MAKAKIPYAGHPTRRSIYLPKLTYAEKKARKGVTVTTTRVKKLNTTDRLNIIQEYLHEKKRSHIVALHYKISAAYVRSLASIYTHKLEPDYTKLFSLTYEKKEHQNAW